MSPVCCTDHHKRIARPVWVGAALLGLCLLLAGCTINWVPELPAYPTAPKSTMVLFRRSTPTATPSPSATPTMTTAPMSRPGTALPDLAGPIAPAGVEDLKEVARWGRGFPQAAVWMPESDVLVTASTRGLYFYARDGLALLGIAEGRVSYRSLDISLDGRYLAAGRDDGVVEVWDAEKSRLLNVLEGHSGAVLDVAFSPGCSKSACLLASASWDATIRIWDLPEGVLRHRLQADGGVHQLAFGPGPARLLSWSHEHPVQVWDAVKGLPEEHLGVGGGMSEWVMLSRDGSVVLVQSGEHTRVHSGENGYTLFTLEDLAVPPERAAFSADGRLLAVTAGNRIQIHRLEDGSLVQSLVFDAADAQPGLLAFTPQGELLAALGDAVRLWDLTQAALLDEVQVKARLDEMALSPDGSMILTWASTSLQARLWAAQQREVPLAGGATLKHEIPIEDAAFAPDGETFATAADGVRLWNTADQALLDTWPAAAQGVEMRIKVFDLDTGQTTFTMLRDQLPLSSVAFSPDGGLLAAGASNRSIYLWKTPSGEPVGILTRGEVQAEEGQRVVRLAFSDDSKRLLAVTERGEMDLWDLAGAQVIQTFQVDELPQDGAPDPCRVWLAGEEVFAAWQDVTFRFGVPDGALIESYSGRCGLRMGVGEAGGLEALPLPGALLQFGAQEESASLQALAYLPDAKILALARGSGSRSQVQVWRVGDGGEAALQLLEEQYWVQPSAVTALQPGERTALQVWQDGQVARYSVPDGQVSRWQMLPGRSLRSAAVSADGRLAALGTWDGRLLLQMEADSLVTGEELLELAAGNYGRLAFSPGCAAAVGDPDPAVCLLAAGKEQGTLELYELPQDGNWAGIPDPYAVIEGTLPALEIRFAADGSLLALRAADGIHVWDIPRVEQLQTFRGDTMAFSPGCGSLEGADCTLAAASTEQMVKRVNLWRVADGKLLWSVESGKGTLQFSPDGELLAAAGRRLDLLRAADGALLASVDNPAPYGKLSFLSDGRLLSAAGWDGVLYLWGIVP